MSKRVIWGPDQEIEAAREYVRRISAEHGWVVEMREVGHPTYQLAVVKGNGFCLCVYPHTTSAGNLHMRVRNQGSKDAEAYSFAVCELYSRSGNNCSFQPKHGVGLTREATLAACRTHPDELTLIKREMGRPYLAGY
jgi:hypothetical protein